MAIVPAETYTIDANGGLLLAIVLILLAIYLIILIVRSLR